MGRPATLKVDIIADAKGVKTGVDDADGHFGRLGSIAGKAGAAVGLGMVAAGAAVGAFALSAVGAASDVQQSYGALESVFGKSSAQVKSWADNASTSVGLSKSSYADLAAVVGAQLTGMGLSADAAAGKTNGLVKMGADLAATFGGSTKDAVEALSSVLKGETDPIERYGISIKQSDINARLAAEGHSQLTGVALKTATAQAALALATEGAAKAHGAFGRETDTLAHQQQVLGAQFDNVKATVGAAFLPVLTSLFTFLSTNLGPAFATVKEAAEVFINAFRGRSEVNEFDGKLRTLNNAGIIVREGFDKVRAFFIDKLVPAFLQLRDYVTGNVIPALHQLATFIGENVVPVLVRLAGFIVDKVIPAVLRVAGPVLDGFRSALKSISGSIDDNRENLAKIGTAFEKVGAVVLKLAPVVGTVLKLAFQAVGGAIGVVLDIVGQVVSAIDKAMGVIDKFAGAASKVGGFLGGLVGHSGGDVLAPMGVQLVGGSPISPAGRQLATAASGVNDGLTPLAGMLAFGGGGSVVIDRRTIDARVTVSGALDPVAVADQLRRILRDQSIRLGLA